FLVDHDFAAPSDALYVMFIGGNDVREARDALRLLLLGVEETPRPESIIAAAVSSIDQSIRALIGAQAEMGSGAKTFLVVNSPNIASLPETRIIAETLGPLGPMFVLGTIQLTKQFNQQLAERLDQIRADQMDSLVKIKEFNLFRFFEGVRFVGKLLGVFENIKDACFSSRLYQATGSLVFVPPLGHPDCEPDEENEPPKCDDFVFFDDIHPTGQVHRIVGKALSKAARKLVDDDDDDD
ncbi:MAG: SGNH/GDSL hydrolase family protein, partial [Acidiferrobacterales bacterium]